MIISDLNMTALHKYDRLKTNHPNCKSLYWTGTEKQFLEMLFTGGWAFANKLTTSWLMGKSHLVCCDWLKKNKNLWLRKIPPVNMCFWHLVLPMGKSVA